MPSADEIKKFTEFVEMRPEYVERVSHRTPKRIEIVEPDPEWPAHFALIASRIRGALGVAAVGIEHVGSTAVPDLPAKPIIDVDVIVADPTDEDVYVPALQAAGFQFLYREPRWHEHRFFGFAEPYANIHIFGPDTADPRRDVMFRDWLKAHAADREKYAAAKREAAAASQAAGEKILEYNVRKQGVLHEIMERMFRAHGFVVDETAEEEK